jgi:hypothetical protein
VIKELLDDRGALFGWTVMVKISDATGKGDDWFWYEIRSVTPGAEPIARGPGVPLCVRCHRGAPDFVHRLGQRE